MKKFGTILLAFVLVVALVGCSYSTSMSWTFKVETGDTIVAKLDTTGGYKISSKTPVVITKDDDTLVECIFLLEESYKEFEANFHDAPNSELIRESTKDGNSYLYAILDLDDYYQYCYLIFVKGSHTGVLLLCEIDEETAADCFERLTLTLDN